MNDKENKKYKYVVRADGMYVGDANCLGLANDMAWRYEQNYFGYEPDLRPRMTIAKEVITDG